MNNLAGKQFEMQKMSARKISTVVQGVSNDVRDLAK